MHMRPLSAHAPSFFILLRVLTAMACLALWDGALRAPAAHAEATVLFEVTDEPARWFKNTAGPIGGTQSLAVVRPGAEVKFTGKSNTVHTITSLVFPTGAAGMPFDTRPLKGSVSVFLTTPGLYVFTCKIHPYMLAAVINDDPRTAGLDLGEQISLLNGLTVKTSSDLATRLLRLFFIATNPANWQDYTSSRPWHVTYPDVDVRITGGAVVNLPAVLNARYGNDIPLPPLSVPSTPGVGEVWVDTQFELTAGKSKPGTATAIDATTWQPRRKVALPQITMNNPHNMWTDRNQRLIYQTQWFDTKLTVFDRESGRLIDNITVGEAPAHVMTRVDTDELHVTLNGAERTDSVVELAPLARGVERRIDIGRGNPHAHWMGHDGRTMVTPNAFTADSTIYDFARDAIRAITRTGAHPIATGMMPDASKTYVANFLDSTITVLNTQTGAVLKTINLLQHYDPESGAITGPVGGLPIQTPVSPNGKYMVTANTLTATITITQTSDDTVVAMLPCDAGCHGVQFGAKKGGGYYAYVASKFSNSLIIVDPDPNNDGDPADATIAGRVALVASGTTARDDRIVGNAGMGGQGVLAIPVVYNGWVQNLPAEWKALLTPAQQNPIGPAAADDSMLAATGAEDALGSSAAWGTLITSKTRDSDALAAAFIPGLTQEVTSFYHCVLTAML
jgi:YVTN family beta-propeller protein